MASERHIFSQQEQSVYSAMRDLAASGARFQDFLERWQALSHGLRIAANRGWLDGLGTRKRRTGGSGTADLGM